MENVDLLVLGHTAFDCIMEVEEFSKVSTFYIFFKKILTNFVIFIQIFVVIEVEIVRNKIFDVRVGKLIVDRNPVKNPWSFSSYEIRHFAVKRSSCF